MRRLGYGTPSPACDKQQRASSWKIVSAFLVEFFPFWKSMNTLDIMEK